MSGSYERGKADPAAPVTWEYVTHEGCEIVLDDGTVLRGLHAASADMICAAFDDAARQKRVIRDYIKALDSVAVVAIDKVYAVSRDVQLARAALRAESLP